MKTLKFGILMVALVLFAAGCQKAESPEDAALKAKPVGVVIPNVEPANVQCGAVYTTPLMAGQFLTAGEVKVWVDGDNLMVKYITNSDWKISETHLAVENTADAIPHTATGNPKIGNFEYNGYYDPMVGDATYSIPLAGLSGTVYIAAHGVVMTQTGEECMAYTEIEAVLPTEPVTLQVTETKVASYYDLVISDAGIFTGNHLAWCADNNHKPEGNDSGTLISSYNPDATLLGQVVPHPENLDLLNYLMNNYYPETPFKILQAAIWNLMNEGVAFTGGGGLGIFTPGELADVAEIVTIVKGNGEGFVPAPGDYLVILVHFGDRTTLQNLLFLYKNCTPVYSGETAWAQGSQFNQSGSWAMYFGYCTGE